jgi:hypothetical protein
MAVYGERLFWMMTTTLSTTLFLPRRLARGDLKIGQIDLSQLFARRNMGMVW